MKEYKFILSSDWENFEHQCSELLKEGWTAQGGISMVATKDHDGYDLFTCAQAFVR